MTTDVDLTRYQGLVLYAIQRHDGKWFRYKVYPNSHRIWNMNNDPDDGWEDELSDAKTWKSTAGPRSAITWYAETYPSLPVPSLVKFTMSNVEVIDETQRIQKAKERKRRQEETREVREKQYKLQQSQDAVRRAQDELLQAQHRLEALQRSG
jgi:hypothetical protein